MTSILWIRSRMGCDPHGRPCAAGFGVRDRVSEVTDESRTILENPETDP
jgi:hypothetical protein